MSAAAGNYPAQPVRMIVGFAAGGPTDVIARLLAQDMSHTLGPSVVVENKTGATSLIATREVAEAPIAGNAYEAARKSVVSGKSVSVRVDLGGCRIFQKNI